METPQYPRGSVPYFHESLNMSPSKAAKMLVGVARSHGKGRGTKAKKGKAAPVKAMMPMRQSGGAKVFGGVKK